MKRTLMTVIATCALLTTLSAWATSRTTQKGYATDREAALHVAARLLNTSTPLRQAMGLPQKGGRLAIHAHQLAVDQALGHSQQALTAQFRIVTQNQDRAGRPLASVDVSVRQISAATQRRTQRAGRWVGFSGQSSTAKIQLSPSISNP